MGKKVISVDYTSRDFNSIKRDLITYARRYYPDTYQDFNEASFGSLMMDTVAYVGDMLSFYLDYNANESFLETALEHDNVVNLAKDLGFNWSEILQSFSYATFTMLIPSKALDNEPDLRYAGKLNPGTVCVTQGGNAFTLLEAVDFLNENTDVVGAVLSADQTRVEWYSLQAKGLMCSGRTYVSEVEMGENFTRFSKVEIPGDNIGDIVSIVTSEGHPFQEVDYLSQNTIFKAVKNTGKYSSSVPHLLKSVACPRRFVVERERGKCYAVFGYGSEDDVKKGNIAEPSEVAINLHGKPFESGVTFDPSKLTSTEKFGIAPVNTTLTVTYRVNSFKNVNAAVGTLNKVLDAKTYFVDEASLDPQKIIYIKENLSVVNEEPINGYTRTLTTEEIKRKARDMYAMQGRAVTKQDYVTAAYAMPSKFGSIKRVSVQRDTDDLRRNINMYVISESASGTLEKTNLAIKENLRTWLNKVRMISDTVDILDATIINLGIEFEVLFEEEKNRFDVMSLAVSEVQEALTKVYPEIGEPFYITDVFKALKDVPGILDVSDIRIYNKSKGNYSDFEYSIEDSISLDGRRIEIPGHCIWEIKNPDADIRGTYKEGVR